MDNSLYEGYLMKKGWLSWAKRWFRLTNEGSLYFFKDQQSLDASGVILLANTTQFTERVPVVRIKQENCFSLTVLETDNIPVSYYLAADTPKELTRWLDIIKPIITPAIEQQQQNSKNSLNDSKQNSKNSLNNLKQNSKNSLNDSKSKNNLDDSKSSKNGVSEPKSSKFQVKIKKNSKGLNFSEDGEISSSEEFDQKREPQSWWGRTTKNLVTKVMVSKFGKKILKDWISPDGIAFLQTVRQIVQKKTESETEAELFEQLALKTFTDIILLITNKVLSKERVLLTRDPIFQLWSDVLDMLEISFVFDELRLHEACLKAWNMLQVIIFPAIEMEKCEQLDRMAYLLSNQEFLIEFYTMEKWKEEREQMKLILRRVWDTTFLRMATNE